MSRQEALLDGLAGKMCADKSNAGVLKELLLVRGAMRYFLKDPKAAQADFEAAFKLKYEGAKGERNPADKDEYLAELLKDYIGLCTDPKSAKGLKEEDE